MRKEDSLADVLRYFDYSGNSRILSGHFPSEKLYPLKQYSFLDERLSSKILQGIQLINDTGDIIFSFLSNSEDTINMFETYGGQEVFQDRINCLMNANCIAESLSYNSEVRREAISHFPAVSKLDKLIWAAALWYSSHDISFFLCKSLSISEHEFETYSLEDKLFSIELAWCYFLIELQDKERLTGKTINIDVIDSNSLLLRLFIDSEWTDEDQKYLVPLSSEEKEKIEEEYRLRAKLSNEAKKEKIKSKEIAERTELAWNQYLSIINELAVREQTVVSQILNEESSVKEKLSAIEEYRSFLKEVDNTNIFSLDGEDVDVNQVFEEVAERIERATCYCCILDQKGKPRRLVPAINKLIEDPTKSFNYLLIKYHQLRLAPTIETAKQFISLALERIETNLKVHTEKLETFDDNLTAFCSVIETFLKDKQSAISELSFDQLQQDSADLVPGISALLFMQEYLSKEISMSLLDVLKKDSALNYEIDVNSDFVEKSKLVAQEYTHSFITNMEKNVERAESLALARQVVVSINIIYLVCDALRMIQTNKKLHSITNDIEAVKRYSNKLYRIDANLIWIAYANLDDDKIGMPEFRTLTGINAITLADHEREQSEQETKRLTESNFMLSSIVLRMKNYIEGIVYDIENNSIERIIEKNKDVREQVFIVPEVDSEKIIESYLDGISARISNALVCNCKTTQSKFETIKLDLYNKLGIKSRQLPPSTVDTLATAELLYRRYAANQSLADSGFDYSSISALYYQAFEDAYNELIWKDYARMLNSLMINEKSYCSIIKEGVFNKAAKGYLPNDPGRYFVKKTKLVDENCMYKNFADLMGQVKSNSYIPHFCEHLARLSGYSNRNEMFSDSCFMDTCKEFAARILESVANRNLASHGGTIIRVDQCINDKKKVINNLERIRSDSYGLIQKLLYLLYKD